MAVAEANGGHSGWQLAWRSTVSTKAKSGYKGCQFSEDMKIYPLVADLSAILFVYKSCHYLYTYVVSLHFGKIRF